MHSSALCCLLLQLETLPRHASYTRTPPATYVCYMYVHTYVCMYVGQLHEESGWTSTKEASRVLSKCSPLNLTPGKTHIYGDDL